VIDNKLEGDDTDWTFLVPSISRTILIVSLTARLIVNNTVPLWLLVLNPRIHEGAFTYNISPDTCQSLTSPTYIAWQSSTTLPCLFTHGDWQPTNSNHGSSNERIVSTRKWKCQHPLVTKPVKRELFAPSKLNTSSKKQIEEIDTTKLQPDSQIAKYSQNKHVIDNKLEGDDTDWTFLVPSISRTILIVSLTARLIENNTVPLFHK
jgi:hypothetical protein